MTVRRSAKSYNVKTCQSCGVVATNVGISRLFPIFTITGLKPIIGSFSFYQDSI